MPYPLFSLVENSISASKVNETEDEDLISFFHSAQEVVSPITELLWMLRVFEMKNVVAEYDSEDLMKPLVKRAGEIFNIRLAGQHDTGSLLRKRATYSSLLQSLRDLLSQFMDCPYFKQTSSTNPDTLTEIWDYAAGLFASELYKFCTSRKLPNQDPFESVANAIKFAEGYRQAHFSLEAVSTSGSVVSQLKVEKDKALEIFRKFFDAGTGATPSQSPDPTEIMENLSKFGVTLEEATKKVLTSVGGRTFEEKRDSIQGKLDQLTKLRETLDKQLLGILQEQAFLENRSFPRTALTTVGNAGTQSSDARRLVEASWSVAHSDDSLPHGHWKSADLSNFQLTGSFLKAKAFSVQFCYLRTLKLVNCDIYDTLMPGLTVAVLGLPVLETLDLSRNWLTKFGLTTLFCLVARRNNPPPKTERATLPSSVAASGAPGKLALRHIILENNPLGFVPFKIRLYNPSGALESSSSYHPYTATCLFAGTKPRCCAVVSGYTASPACGAICNFQIERPATGPPPTFSLGW